MCRAVLRKGRGAGGVGLPGVSASGGLGFRPGRLTLPGGRTLPTESKVKFQFLRIRWCKLLRAYGGCLGVKRRRRTWDTAISPGEPCAGARAGDVRMGKPVPPTQVG